VWTVFQNFFHRVIHKKILYLYITKISTSLHYVATLPCYTRFRPPSATVVSAEPFSHGTGTLRCLQKEMATYRHWSVSLWRDPDDVSHCRILSPDKTEWQLISATLCGWGRCFVADQLWLMTRIREEEECVNTLYVCLSVRLYLSIFLSMSLSLSLSPSLDVCIYVCIYIFSCIRQMTAKKSLKIKKCKIAKQHKCTSN